MFVLWILALENLKNESDDEGIYNIALVLAHAKDFIELVEDALADGKIDPGELQEIKELAARLCEEVSTVIPTD